MIYIEVGEDIEAIISHQSASETSLLAQFIVNNNEKDFTTSSDYEYIQNFDRSS